MSLNLATSSTVKRDKRFVNKNLYSIFCASLVFILGLLLVGCLGNFHSGRCGDLKLGHYPKSDETHFSSYCGTILASIALAILAVHFRRNTTACYVPHCWYLRFRVQSHAPATANSRALQRHQPPRRPLPARLHLVSRPTMPMPSPALRRRPMFP